MTIRLYDVARSTVFQPPAPVEHQSCTCFIIPPHMTEKLSSHPDAILQPIYKHNHDVSREIRAARSVAKTAAAAGNVVVYDARNKTSLPGKVVKDIKGSHDQDKIRAFNFGNATRDFYKKVLGRDSIDGKGMELKMVVHYRRNYDNAFWNGQYMVFGDGDPRGRNQIFGSFTADPDVTGHEITHGVTDNAVPGGGLVYQGESGALNESMSDVFGIQVKDFALKREVAKSNWLIGEEVLIDIGGKPYALRNMLKPGTAYLNHPFLGNDPQPGHMTQYQTMTEDNGGVHINSGIPNKAFATACTLFGGVSSDMGKIWYAALPKLTPNATFLLMAQKTMEVAKEKFGESSKEYGAVVGGWREVGVIK